MMTLDGAQQRRRIATYGKAARRRVQGVASENDYVKGVARPSATANDKAGTVIAPRENSDYISPSNYGGGSLQSASKLKSPKSITSHASVEGVLDDNTNMFDVPSSEDETANTYTGPSKALKAERNDKAPKYKRDLNDESHPPSKTNRYSSKDNRKRKRNIETSTTAGPEILLDDNILQRHIAKEIREGVSGSDIPATITPPTSSDERQSNSPIKPKPSAVSRPQEFANKSHQVPATSSDAALSSRHQKLGKINSKALADNPSSFPKDTKSTASTTPNKSGKRQRPGGLKNTTSLEDRSSGASSQTPEKASRSRSRNTTPDHARPASRHSVTNVTSPTQARLWNDLFPQAYGEPSPSQLKMNQLTIFDRQARSAASFEKDRQKPESDAFQISDLDQPIPRGAPRKRLIDLLDTAALSAEIDQPINQSNLDRDEDIEMAETTVKNPVANLSLGEESVNTLKKATTEQVDGPKRTYARQRTYLTDNDLLDAAKFSLAPESDFETARPVSKLGTRRPTRLIPNVGLKDSVLNDQEASSTGGIRSIHELRQAGGNKRYLDEVESVLEDLDTSQKTTTSGKRLALMSLVTKFSTIEYGRKFVSHGLDEKLLSFMRADDVICSSFYCSILSSLISGGFIAGSTIQTYQTSIINLAEPLLEIERSLVAIGRDRRSNMSKATQSQLAEVSSLIKKANYWDGNLPEVMSPYLLALKCIDAILRKTREISDISKTLSITTLQRLIESLCQISGEETPPTQNDLAEVELIMSILESHTLIGGEEQTRQALNSSLLPGIAACLPIVLELDENSHKNLQWLALRLTVNATSNGTSHSNSSEQPELIQALTSNILRKFDALSGCIEQQDREFARDSLIISLASLINLTEWSGNGRHWLSQNNNDKETLLSALLDVFSQKLDTTSEAYSMEEVESNIPFGYLAVLLGNLCKEDAIRLQIQQQLPGKSLNTLIDTISEFLKHHQTIESQVDDLEGANAQDGLTDKLRSVVRRLRIMEGHS